MAKENLPISSSLEDYLEAISEIIEEGEHAHTKEIAVKLGVSMPSVTNALQSLAARNMIIYRSHAPVRLTEDGAARAAVIRRRHQALRRFFVNLLKVDADAADEAACQIEHVIKEPITSRMTALIEAVEEREDCSGLRAFLAETMPEISPANAELISLDKLPADHRGELVYVSENLRGIKKFADMGLVPGAVLQYEGIAPFGDLIRIKLMNTQLSLRTGDARYFWVKVLD